MSIASLDPSVISASLYLLAVLVFVFSVVAAIRSEKAAIGTLHVVVGLLVAGGLAFFAGQVL